MYIYTRTKCPPKAGIRAQGPHPGPQGTPRDPALGPGTPQCPGIRWPSGWYPETCVQNPRIPGATPHSNISAPGLKAPEAC